MFAKAAPKYDLGNKVLSFNIYRRWYKKLLIMGGISKGDNVLDCATGTGCLAFEIEKLVGKSGSVIGVDFTPEMLDVANEKAKEYNSSVKFEIGDVLELKFPDNSFDKTTIAFGIRNVENAECGLKEMARVVRSGGVVAILEFGKSKGILSFFYRIYFSIFFPIIAKLLGLDSSAYKYLTESSSEFPCREDFLNIMGKTNNFSDYYFKSLSGGIAYIYIGIVT